MSSSPTDISLCLVTLVQVGFIHWYSNVPMDDFCNTKGNFFYKEKEEKLFEMYNGNDRVVRRWKAHVRNRNRNIKLSFKQYQ